MSKSFRFIGAEKDVDKFMEALVKIEIDVMRVSPGVVRVTTWDSEERAKMFILRNLCNLTQKDN